MAINLEVIEQAVAAENDRLNKSDVEKLRVRLEEISRLKKAQAKQFAAYQEQIDAIQKEIVGLQTNSVTLEDAVGDAQV